MRRADLLVLALLVAACTGADDAATTTLQGPTTTAAAATTTSVTQDCGPIPYEVGELPSRVEEETPEPEEVPQDVFTTVPGTISRLWLDEDGELAMVLVRGSLPPIEWPGDRGEVSIDGVRGVAGQLDDGSWMVGWFEGDEDPCDRYFMVFYDPVEPEEVEAAIASLDRTG